MLGSSRIFVLHSGLIGAIDTALFMIALHSVAVGPCVSVTSTQWNGTKCASFVSVH